MPRRSIHLRLQLWFGFLLAALVSGFGATAYQLQKDAELARIDAELEQQVDRISVAFRGADMEEHFRSRERGKKPPRLDRPPGDRLPPPLSMARPPERHRRTPVQLPASVTNFFASSNRYVFAIWGEEEALLAQSAPEVREIPRPQARGWATRIQHRARGTWRDAYHFTEMRDCVLVGRDVAADLAGLRRYAWGLAAIGGLVLSLGLGGGFLISSLLLRSIRHISRTAQRISEGNLADRIPTEKMDRELGQLGDVLNATFARLDAAFARQRQFTADAAHELRTPLAVIISDAQMALRRERTPEEYRDTIHACEAAAQEMRHLAESLLELARLDAGGEPGVRMPVDLAELARAGAEHVRPLAELRDLRIELDVQPAAISGNPEQIGRVFTNLLANAIDYNRPGGSIRVATRTEPGWAIAVVEDTGIGIAPEALPRVFDRFYRASSARASADGHGGLGLAICKGLVEAHGGRIEVASQPGQGTVFTVSWPRESPPA